MKLLVMADNLDGIRPMMEVAATNDYQMKIIGCKDEALPSVCHYAPDALIIACEQMEDVTLRELKKVSEASPLPVVVFTSDSDMAVINEAVHSGASAYVVDCKEPGRLGTLLEVARARFEETRLLKKELDKTRCALQDRKIIEKAKGIIMKSRSVSEEQAYNAMRKLAMNQNRRMSDIAHQVVEASKVLV